MAAIGPRSRFIGLELISEDVEAAVRFYAWLLGDRRHPRIPRWDSLQLLAERGVVSVRSSGTGNPPPGWLPVFHVDSVAKVQRILGSREGSSSDAPGQPVSHYGIDPAGAWLGLADGEYPVGQVEALNGTNCDYAATETHTVAAALAEALGLDYAAIPDDPYNFHVLYDGPYKAHGVVKFGGSFDEAWHSTWVVYFDVDDVDTVAVRALEAGARILVPPADTPVNRYAVLEDPQQRVFGISSMLPRESRAASLVVDSFGGHFSYDGELLVPVSEVSRA